MPDKSSASATGVARKLRLVKPRLVIYIDAADVDNIPRFVTAPELARTWGVKPGHRKTRKFVEVVDDDE